MARDDIADGTNNVVNGEWRRGQRVPIPMVAAPVSGIIQNSKGTLDEQIHRARDTQKNFFFDPSCPHARITFSLEEFLFRFEGLEARII